MSLMGNVNSLAKLLGVSTDTVRRWTREYAEFLSPTGSPTKGKMRVLNTTDMQILTFIAGQRSLGADKDAISNKLIVLRARDWQGLPDLPSEWDETQNSTVPVELAVARASEIAQIAVLQREVEHLNKSLEEAETRVKKLELELEDLRTQKETSERDKHALEIELEKARGEVTRLHAEQHAYDLAYGFGTGKPVSIALIISAALLIGILLVVVAALVLKLVA
jgi:DNA-binding transcriptional MerR regulator